MSTYTSSLKRPNRVTGMLAAALAASALAGGAAVIAADGDSPPPAQSSDPAAGPAPQLDLGVLRHHGVRVQRPAPSTGGATPSDPQVSAGERFHHYR